MTFSSQPGDPTLGEWLARNPTGIPRRIAVTRAAVGVLLAGLVSTAVARRSRPAEPLGRLLRESAGAALLGGTVGPLCVTVATYYLDRSLLRQDELLGYSGVMRELLHAGELSFLGALGAGLGQRTALTSTVGTTATGALLYGARGLGPGLGAGAGLFSGLIGGVLGRAARGGRRGTGES